MVSLLAPLFGGNCGRCTLHRYLQLGNTVTDTTRWMDVVRTVQQPRRQATVSMARSISVTQYGPSDTMDFERHFQEQRVSSSVVPNHQAVPPSPFPVQTHSGRAYDSGGNYNPAGTRATSLNTGNGVHGGSPHRNTNEQQRNKCCTIFACFVKCVVLSGCITFIVVISLMIAWAKDQNATTDKIIPPVTFPPDTPVPTYSPTPSLRPVTNRPIASPTRKPVILV